MSKAPVAPAVPRAAWSVLPPSGKVRVPPEALTPGLALSQMRKVAFSAKETA